MKPRRARLSAQQWSTLVAEFSASQESPKIFCERKDLSLTTFQKWWRRFNKPRSLPLPPVAASDFVPVQSARLRSSDASSSKLTLQIGPHITVSIQVAGGIQ